MRRDFLLYTSVAVGTLVLLTAASKAKAGEPRLSQGYSELRRLASKVDPYIPGFSKFAPAVAYTESRGNSEAMNSTASEAAAACRGYRRKADTLYADNLYPEKDWCWGSGGWFGFLPSTALAAEGFHNFDPYLVFDPEAQVAMFADFVRRIARNWFHRLPPDQRNWLAIRRFMAGNTVGLDWQEQKVLKSDKDGVPRAVKTRERFEKALRETGVKPSFMYQRVRFKDWPGAIQLWGILE